MEKVEYEATGDKDFPGVAEQVDLLIESRTQFKTNLRATPKKIGHNLALFSLI